MQYPFFYTEVPTIILYDPLSDFLGAFENGEIQISYLACVKLAGHSCPTVAGAYMMAAKGLKLLYPDSLPHRGSIKVEIKEPRDNGVAGVIGNVISYIVGAGDEGGFKGIQGNFARNNLIKFDTPMQGEVTLTRVDIQRSVTLSYDPSSVPPDERMKPLMGKTLQGTASSKEKELFKTLWQDRVRKILLTPELSDAMITVTKNYTKEL